MSNALNKQRLGLARPTVSIAVFRSEPLEADDSWHELLDADRRASLLSSEVLVVRFRSKFNGGIALPGEGWDHLGENPEDAAIRAAKEELGLTVTRQQLFPLTTRALRGRDTRTKPFRLHKMAHGRSVPRELEGVDEGIFFPDHCIDMVFGIWGVDNDPATLRPVDTEEVRAIESLDIDDPLLPPLPISDDTALIQMLAKWRRGDIEHAPAFLHFA